MPVRLMFLFGLSVVLLLLLINLLQFTDPPGNLVDVQVVFTWFRNHASWVEKYYSTQY